MTRRVLECVQWDEAANVCISEAWVESPDAFERITAMLPTVDQAQAVGTVFFGTLVLIAAMGLLSTKRM